MVAIMPQQINLNVTRAWLAAGLVTLGMGAAQAAEIRLQVAGLSEGMLHAQLHAVEAGDWDAPVRQASGRPGLLVFDDVPPGRYAIELFVDLNGNGELDVSPRGIPREPFGFSNNPRLKRSKPALQDCAFEHGEEPSEVIVELQGPALARDAARTVD